MEERHARRMANLFVHAPVGIAVLRGADHVFELVNPKYAQLLGGRDVSGRKIREALPELEGQGIFELLDGVRRSGEPVIGQSMTTTLNNGPQGAPQECFFDFVYQPLLNDAKEIEGIVVIAHDVTELARAKQNAEAANRLKDEFLATLSHELRTPLNAVLGYTQMLRGGVIAPERLAGVLSIIERNAQLQEQLISDVLDVSRIVTGKLRLDIEPVDLKIVVEEALTTVAPAAAAKGVRTQVTLDSPGVPVAGDAARLQQVVWNVLSNAIKFTARGGRVQVRLQRVNSHVEIVVSDTGEGIDPEMLPHVFQRFWQADSSFTRVHGGLGLGLAISRHLVEAHGGAIEAISPGKGLGTTIRIALPVMILHHDVDAPARAHPSRETPPEDPLHLEDLAGLRVLLVDDDVDALAMARDALSIAGASVVTAAGADDALGALAREPFDVAVVDIGMPVVDGYELLRRIRGLDGGRLAGLPVAALTAYARTADRTRSLRAGFQMHLAKPVQPNELTAAVASLGRRRSSGT
jgi:signal transduction histidine kinase/CheY-like chemotaxis protein